MPILNELSAEAEWIDPDQVPRPVVTYGFMAEQFDGIELDPHRHAKGQMLLVQRGALSCEVQGGLWIVPPRSAVWIPGGALHSIRIAGAIEGYGAFVDGSACAGLPESCCAVSVTPLLRELLSRAARLPVFYDENGTNARLVAVLLDEIAAARVENLHLPMPRDPRLRRIAARMMETPGDRAPMSAWAKRGGLSERSLARLILRETGMSFDRWRQRLCVMRAVERLAEGGSIQQVAGDLGYQSVPSFVTMFRKVLGTSPGRYMAERHVSTPEA